MTRLSNQMTAPSADGVWQNCRLAAGMQAAANSPALPDAAIVVRDGLISWVGPSAALGTAGADLPRRDGGGAWVTPGLIDCHTHLVYGGQRAEEFALRLAGAGYAEIARSGGGILSTVRATRNASEDDLFAIASLRLQSLLDEGVAAIEIKSGYGLDLENERKQLRVARRLADAHGVTVRTTFLGAHALPPEYAGRADEYISFLCARMLPALAEEGLVDAVDAFCENIGFSLAQTTRVFEAATRLGLPLKLHAEQLSDMDGSALAASFGAISCDHLEHLSSAGIEAMRKSGTVAVLLPGAFYALRETRLPPIDALRRAGVPIALATDHNPGTAPGLSLLLMLNMACTLFRMTVPEVLAGVTRHAARALRLEDTHGAVASGRPANFVLWQVDDPAELAYWFGRRLPCTVVRQGRIVIRSGYRGSAAQ